MFDNIGPAQAERCIDAYVEAWNEPESGRRTRMLAPLLADGAVYCDPATVARGAAGIAEYIGQVQARYPGARIVRTSAVDVHHFSCRFHWRMARADGSALPDSIDFVHFTEDGRIRQVTGFFGTPAPHPAA